MTSPGEVLNGRYRLVERLGGGSMGSVWKAKDTVLGRTVAVKELLSGSDGAEPIEVRRERVRREAFALAAVEHPAIVTVHDLISVGPGEDPWIVMGYVRGVPLNRRIASGPPLRRQEIASIGRGVLAGLTACHKLRVYHRDVKPANIVVGEDGWVRLVDFGIVKIVGQVPLTAVRNVLGTPEFLAPELLNGQPPGPATDLWALGVTLYCALTGVTPFRAETLGATFAAILAMKPHVPRGGGPLADLVLQMLNKHPADRPDSSRVDAVLRSVAEGEDQRSRTPAPGPGGPPRMHDRTDHWPLRQPSTFPEDAHPLRPGQRPARLSGLTVEDAARMVASWPADRAAIELLTLDPTEVAKIINHCTTSVGGNVLSAIVTDQPARTRKILDIVMVDRAGQLLDHMSSAAAANALALPPVAGAALRLAEADISTVVGVLTEMTPRSAAQLVQAMDEAHAVDALDGMLDPARAADILSHIFPASRKQALLNRLSSPFRDLVSKHLQRTSDPDTSAG